MRNDLLLQFWIRVPMIAPEDSVGDVFEEEEEEEEEGKTGLKHDTWHWCVTGLHPPH